MFFGDFGNMVPSFVVSVVKRFWQLGFCPEPMVFPAIYAACSNVLAPTLAEVLSVLCVLRGEGFGLSFR